MNRITENSTSTRIGQQNQEQYNNHHDNHDDLARACACAREAQLLLIAEAYRANVAKTITAAVAQMIEDALDHGMDCDSIIWACEETGLAPNPSPRYLRAVLRNWALRGHVSSRVHGQEKDIQARPWYHLDHKEYRAASEANGEDPDKWWE